jgi:hypothetical protein
LVIRLLPAGAVVAAVGDRVVDEENRRREEDTAKHYECADHHSILSSSQHDGVAHAPEPEGNTAEANPRRKWTVGDELTEQHARGREVRDVAQRVRDKDSVIVRKFYHRRSDRLRQ